MELLRTAFDLLLSPTSIWSVVARGVFWVVIAIVIIISTDSPDPQKSLKNLKSNLGFLLMFLFLSGTLMFLLFGFVPMGQG